MPTNKNPRSGSLTGPASVQFGRPVATPRAQQYARPTTAATTSLSPKQYNNLHFTARPSHKPLEGPKWSTIDDDKQRRREDQENNNLNQGAFANNSDSIAQIHVDERTILSSQLPSNMDNAQFQTSRDPVSSDPIRSDDFKLESSRIEGVMDVMVHSDGDEDESSSSKDDVEKDADYKEHSYLKRKRLNTTKKEPKEKLLEDIVFSSSPVKSSQKDSDIVVTNPGSMSKPDFIHNLAPNRKLKSASKSIANQDDIKGKFGLINPIAPINDIEDARKRFKLKDQKKIGSKEDFSLPAPLQEREDLMARLDALKSKISSPSPSSINHKQLESSQSLDEPKLIKSLPNEITSVSENNETLNLTSAPSTESARPAINVAQTSSSSSSFRVSPRKRKQTQRYEQVSLSKPCTKKCKSRDANQPTIDGKLPIPTSSSSAPPTSSSSSAKEHYTDAVKGALSNSRKVASQGTKLMRSSLSEDTFLAKMKKNAAISSNMLRAMKERKDVDLEKEITVKIGLVASLDDEGIYLRQKEAVLKKYRDRGITYPTPTAQELRATVDAMDHKISDLLVSGTLFKSPSFLEAQKIANESRHATLSHSEFMALHILKLFPIGYLGMKRHSSLAHIIKTKFNPEIKKLGENKVLRFWGEDSFVLYVIVPEVAVCIAGDYLQKESAGFKRDWDSEARKIIRETADYGKFISDEVSLYAPT